MPDSNRRRNSDTALAELADSVRCLHVSFERFNKKYSPVLDNMIARDKYWTGVKDDAIKGVAKWTVLGVLAAIGTAIIYYIQAHFGIDVGAKK